MVVSNKGIDNSMRQECPNCQSKAFKRNGYTRHGKQNHRCLECGRQFSLEPISSMPEDTTEIVQGFFVEISTESKDIK